MKTVKTTNAVIAIALTFALAFVFAGCGNGGGGKSGGGGYNGGTQAQRTLVITNVPADVYEIAYYYGGSLGVFPVGITTQQALNWTGVVAGAYLDNDDILISGYGPYTISIPLYTLSNSQWTGSGTYDVCLELYGDGGHYYKASSVSFSSATTTISFINAQEIFPNGGSGNNNEGSLYAKAPPVFSYDTPVNLSGTEGATIVDRAVAYVNANPGTYTLLLKSDVNVAGSPGRAFNKSNVNLTIIGVDAERKISLTSAGQVFTVGSIWPTETTGITLTLNDNITLVGYDNNSYGAAVIVTEGSAFIMQGNTKITKNTNGSSGGGVILYEGNMTRDTTFIMKDNASVTNNTSTSQGGGVAIMGEKCTFTMQDNASVSGNDTSFSNSGYGGGVYVGWGTFNMYGGTVSGNTTRGGGGGVAVGNGTFKMYGGTVYGSDASSTLANTASLAGAALYLDGNSAIAEYGDGSNILPNMGGSSYYTNNTITGR